VAAVAHEHQPAAIRTGGAAETTWSRAISATGAGALHFLKSFGHWEVLVSSLIEYRPSDTPAGTGWSTHGAVPSAQADQTQLRFGIRHVPGSARSTTLVLVSSDDPQALGRCVPLPGTACGPWNPGGGVPRGP
jgi:hypothetical protein